MKLRELRTARKWTQGELGTMLGVSGQTILNWENGIHEPKIAQLIQLADIFHITVDELLEHKVDHPRSEIVCEELEKIPRKDWIHFIKSYLDHLES